MTDLPDEPTAKQPAGPTIDRPAALLADLGALRRRARRDRRGYWLPLLLFGALILLAPLLYSGSAAELTGGGNPGPVLRLGPLTIEPLAAFSGTTMGGDSVAVALYWLGAIVVGVAATLGWYRWRARRVGIETRTGTIALGALGALGVYVLVLPSSVGAAVFDAVGGYGPAALWIGAAAFAIGGTAAALLIRRAHPAGRTGAVLRGIGIALAVLLALTGTATIGLMAATHGYTALLVIGVGLFALAAVERSALCTAIAVLFGVAALLANLYNVENVFAALGQSIDNAPARLLAFDDLLPAAAVLILGGIGALVTGQRRA